MRQSSLALLLENDQNYDDALKYLNQAVQRGIADDNVFSNLGNNFLVRRDFDTAVKYYRQALEINEHHSNALNGIGAALMHANEQPDLNSLVLAASYFPRTALSCINAWRASAQFMIARSDWEHPHCAS